MSRGSVDPWVALGKGSMRSQASGAVVVTFAAADRIEALTDARVASGFNATSIGGPAVGRRHVRSGLAPVHAAEVR